MKAKEYATRLKCGDMDIADVACAFLNEVKSIAETRKAHTDSAVVSILDEQSQKWRALSRLYPSLRPDGFDFLVSDQMPDVFRLWKSGNS